MLAYNIIVKKLANSREEFNLTISHVTYINASLKLHLNFISMIFIAH